MNTKNYISQKKEFLKVLLSFLDTQDNNDDQQLLFELIDSQKFSENREELKELLYLLSKISKNHHRTPNFFIRIEQILLYCDDQIKQTFSNNEIFSIFKTNKRILLFLFENKTIAMNDFIFQYLKSKNNDGYFSPEIQKFIKNENSEISIESTSNFEEKRKIGENDDYICELIRNDSIDEFVIYVNQTNLSLSKTTIKPSIFETNSFLLKNKETSLIEYAAFFGSIQIFQYLRLNNVDIKQSIWLYSIHSKNADLIHLVEECDVNPPNDSFERCFEESIKCHHNEIAYYFQTNFLTEKTDFPNYNENPLLYCFRFRNYEFFPTDFENKFINFYLSQYDYINLVQLLLKEKRIELNDTIVKYFNFF